MSFSINPMTWFGTKTVNFDLQSLKKYYRNKSHPEEYKARTVIAANYDAQALRLNNDLVSSYSKSIQQGVVGTGFTLQYKSDDDDLNKKVEFFLEYWSEYKNCEITKRFFRQDFERFLVSEAAVIGGFIIRHHWDKTLKTFYNMEILSTTTIDRTKNDFRKGLYYGVQTNKKGQISGIHIYKDNERMASSYHTMKNLILYVDVWTDPHQYTNVTPLAPILNTLDKLASYADAEIKNAKKRAEKSVIIATEAYSMMLQAQEEYIDLQVKEGTPALVEEAEQHYQEMIAGFSANGLHEGATPIMPGDNTKVWDLASSGSTVYADISLNSKQIISKALGLSPSTIAGIPESSYNVALKNAQSDERAYAILAQQITEKVLKDVYRKAIEAGYLLGLYNLTDYYTNKIKYDSYLKITRKQLAHIDPIKATAANTLGVESGQTSMMTVIANNGKNYLDVINDEVTYELARKQALEKAGLKYIQTGAEDIALQESKQIQEDDAKETEDEIKKEEKDEN